MPNIYRQVRGCFWKVTCCFYVYNELTASSNLIWKEKSILLSSGRGKGLENELSS